jgi:hypothetical protein
MWSRHRPRDHVGIQAHDQSGPPCLPAYHRPFLRLPSGWLRPLRWLPTSAVTCSATSPRSPTPATGVADGNWSACSASRSARCWPAPDPWARSASGPATRPARTWPRSGPAATPDRHLAATRRGDRAPRVGPRRPRRPRSRHRRLAGGPATILTDTSAATGTPPAAPDGRHRRARPCVAAATTATRRFTCSP